MHARGPRRSSIRSGCRRSTTRGSPTPPTSRSSSSARSRSTRSRRCSTTYLASLPSRGTADVDGSATCGCSSRRRCMRETVNKGQEPRSQTVITLLRRHRPRRARDASRCARRASVLQMRLRDILREELGGTYSVGVGYSDNVAAARLRHDERAVRQLAGERGEPHQGGDGRGRAAAARRAVGGRRPGRQGNGEERPRRRRFGRTATG